MSAYVIGLGISRSQLRVVAARRDEIVWVASEKWDRAEALSAIVARLLAARPVVLNRRARVVAVVGTNASQLRPLSGLPPVRDLNELHALISQSVDRFFVHDGGNVRVSTPCLTVSGETWASAVDGRVIAEVAAGCRMAGVSFVGALPVAAALRHVTGVEHQRTTPANSSTECEVIWSDEGTRLRLSYEGWVPRRVTRERATTTQPDGLVTAAGLPDAVPPSHADAFAATRVRARDHFVIGERTESFLVERQSRIRTWIWGATAIASIALAGWAPAALAIHRTEVARAQAVVLRQRARQAEKAQRELATATAELNLVSRFQGSRHSATLLLGELALALPESTAVTSLRVDSVGGTVMVVTPHAATVLDAMTLMPGIHRVQVAGPMTREATNGIELERATIRFGFTVPGHKP